jgi:uncharacterized protein
MEDHGPNRKVDNAFEGTSHEALLTLARMRMPFGKYEGRLLIDLPEPYVVWMAQRGFPTGTLGDMLRSVYEIKVNGLEYLFDSIRGDITQ